MMNFTMQNPLIPKIASAHTRLILFEMGISMKKRRKKTAIPNKVRYGIAVMRFCSIVVQPRKKRG